MVARKIIWSTRAQNDRYDILEYWIKRTGSTSYSIKLNFFFKEAAQLIAIHPEIGKPSEMRNIRTKIIKEYLMIYKIADEVVYILNLWNTRKDPDKLESLIRDGE